MTLDSSQRQGALGRRFIDIDDERSGAILRILDAGWKRAAASPDVHAGAGEVEVTEQLRTGMRAALSARVAAWCKKMTVLPGTESRSKPDSPRPDGRTDIPVFFQDIREEFDEHDPHAIIECKRVAGGDAKLCRLYVANGVDRFKTGKYASNHAVGFMVGYLLSGNADSASDGINAYLTGRGRRSEHLRPSSVPAAPWARSSRHRRQDSGEPITLHHAFCGLQPTPA